MVIKRALLTVSGAALAAALVVPSASTAVADQVRDDQWALDALDAESAWKISKGEGQTVAVIDTGVNPDHPDLVGNVLRGKDFIDGGDPLPDEGDGHGTAMASLIAGHGHGPGKSEGVMGLAPEAKILPVRSDGIGSNSGADAVKYAVDQGATVISWSQGSAGKPDPDVVDAIAYALERDVPVFASTGNSGAPVEYPAANPGVVAVGGVTEDGTIWSDSNKGPETLLVAPATRIVGASSGAGESYRMGTGTSDATAYAAAAAALLRAEFPDLTAGQVVNRLTKTAELPPSIEGAKLPHSQYGYGAIRPTAALTAEIPKGSEFGPLRVPQAIKDARQEAQEQKERLAESAEMQKQADRKAIIAWSVIGAVGLLVIALVVWLVVRRRRKRNRPGGPGGPGGFPGPPGPGHPYPYQQQPYGQQPPPQYTSYGTPPPQGHPAPPPQPPPR
ncbi:type VII secretion-associated serine protease mycosin [Streptomyces sp. RKND-216]|uniref:S8 family serine peptidase n=1 Tax=Streptomyces sp. RKND-216 TaxID=2562581 RepID=UPI00109DDBBB|nr:S8 family serine peptidase [Streptomyces sp. RKND-216]THA23509.1 type VII secretion-associated serine protease mycosin [Streptomyces sp. RKND-216]